MAADLLLDISRLIGRTAQGRLPTGVDRVCIAYVERWGARARAVVQKGNWRRLFPYRESQELFSLLLDRPAHFAQRVNWVIAKACVPPWPSQTAPATPGFYLGHSGTEARGFVPWVRGTRQKPVYFVHDLIPISHPEYCRAGEQALHKQRLAAMLHTGAGLVANSQDTLDAMARFAAAQGLAMPPSVVAPLAPATLLSVPQNSLTRPEIQKPYFVVLGTIEPRKNHLLLLNVWRDLALRLGEQCPRLLVIGQRGWECENVVDMLERCEALRPFVQEISACDDAALAHYLQHACALLFPSFVEGYGIPMVEALMLGTPVIASDLGVFREIAGDIPDFLDPTDGPGWAQSVLDFMASGSVRRERQLRRMASFSAPTWDAHFAQVERLLEQLQ